MDLEKLERTKDQPGRGSARPMIKRSTGKWVEKKPSIWHNRDFRAAMALAIGLAVVALAFWLVE